MMLIILIAIVCLCVCVKGYLYLIAGRYVMKKSLYGKHILITGGTAGIGKECVRQFALHGAIVHVLARNMAKAEAMIEEFRSIGSDIHAHELNLSSFKSVRKFATAFLASGLPIHILINNAGVVNKIKRMTEDGIENTIQSNHLGHFLLTNLLLPRIVESGPGARIVNVTSHAHVHVDEFDPSDLNFEHKSYPILGGRVYAYSKLANILFTRELARRADHVNCLHPGVIRTELLRHFVWYHPFTLVMRLLMIFTKTTLQGSQTTIFLSVADEVENINGHYFADCKPSAPSLLALDDKLAKDLWEESVKLTDLRM